MVVGFTFAFEPAIHGTIRHVCIYYFLLLIKVPFPDHEFSSLLKLLIRSRMCLWLDLCSPRQQGLSNYGNRMSSNGQERSPFPRSRALNLLTFQKRKSSKMHWTVIISSHASCGKLEIPEWVFFSSWRKVRSNSTQGFPAYIAGFGRRFLIGSSAASGSIYRKGSDGSLWRDTFGFRKLLVVSSSTGKVFGIDTAQGDIVWSRLLVAASHTGGVKPFKHFAVTTVSDGKHPEIVLLGHCHSPSVGLVSTRIVSF